MNTKTKQLIAIAIMVLLPYYSIGQVDLKTIQRKAKEKTTKTEGQQEEKKKEDAEPKKTEKKEETKATLSIANAVKKEQADLASSNRMQIEKKIESIFDISREDGDKAYLSFTNDYRKPNANMTEFTGKDFIYAKVNTNKSMHAYISEKATSDIQYYRLRVHIRVGSANRYNENKIQKNEWFELAYSDKDLMLAVVPEKGFFENMTEKYKVNGDFPDSETKNRAYADIISRNFSRQLSEVLKDIEPGEHKVEVEFEAFAKEKGSEYTKLSNMKGVFMLKVDEEAKQRYSDTYDLLTELYREYEGKQSIASQTIFAESEEKMLANMSPRDRERYNIAKNSPEGYMAAYGGKKVVVSFVFDALRDKPAHIDIIWPQGSCETCEAGTSSVYVAKGFSADFNIPVGAKVSMNGRTLVQSVSNHQNITIHWFY